MILKSFTAVILLGAVVDAHVKMVQPTPYGANSLSTSPLQADGSDFPCKLRPDVWEAPDQSNTMKVGESQTLKLMGSAVHGGGSCQISLTRDMHPSKDSKWMVITSIEGGCPVNAVGNLPGSAETVNSLDFTIPNGVEPGKYTLAWTWFNRIGNREMYMNCAPVNIQGGSSAKRSEPQSKAISKRSKFPPMFVANVNGCTTTEMIDIRFPNPGDNLIFNGDPSNLEPAGQPACTGTPTFGAAGMNSAGSDGSFPPTGSGPSPAPSATPDPPSGGGPVVSAPGRPSPTPGPPSPPAPEPAPPALGSGSSGSNSGSGSIGGQTGSCDSEGIWNCIDGSSFQRCASGHWTPAQPMAPGTKCTPGQSQDFRLSAANTRRMAPDMRRKRSHGHTHT